MTPDAIDRLILDMESYVLLMAQDHLRGRAPLGGFTTKNLEAAYRELRGQIQEFLDGEKDV